MTRRVPINFMYGWHQDYKSNIQGSKFLQLWMPVTNDVNRNIGLHVMEESFTQDIKTTHTKVERKEKLTHLLELVMILKLKISKKSNKTPHVNMVFIYLIQC